MRSWQVLREPRLRLAGFVNTGIVGFPRAAYDADLLEWFLAHPAYHRTPVWVEQTAWALLGARQGCRFVDPVRVRLPGERFVPPEGLVALHFVTPRRALLPLYAGLVRDAAGAVPVVLTTVPAPGCPWWSLAVTEIRRRLARW